MRIRFALIGLALAGTVSASAAPRATIAPAPPAYQIETHVIGSGGYSISVDEDYVLDLVGWHGEVVQHHRLRNRRRLLAVHVEGRLLGSDTGVHD